MRIRPVETSGLPMPFQRRGQGPVIVGSPDPLAWANKADGAKHAWDFIANAARWNGQYIGALANTPNWTFTRASTGYAQTAAGVLVPFASGELRRTDKGVLIEGAGTNLCLQSQTFDHASWTKGNCTVTANAIAAPDGTMTADLVTVDTTTNTTMKQAVGAVTGTNCTATVYIQAGNIVSPTGSVTLYDTTAAGNVVSGTITWATMSVSGTGASIERVGSTNWYRVTLSTSSWVSGNSARIYWGAAGGPLTIGSSWYVWGSQLEAASFPSSYIPTTTASATRAADVLTVPVSGIDYPISLFAEFERAVDTGGNEFYFRVDNGSNNETANLYVTSSDFFSASMLTGGYGLADTNVTTANAVGATIKTAGRFALNDTVGARNGVKATTDTVCAVPLTPTTARFGSNVTSAPCFGYLRRAALWTRALTDAELQAVTT